MTFSLIICTYRRAASLQCLLQSVSSQTCYPDEILIVDGSEDRETAEMLAGTSYPGLRYILVPPAERGLTRQRNYGIANIDPASEIVCFLDDDTVLESDYFERLIETYSLFPDALGAGGYITNESDCVYVGENYVPTRREYFYDGWKRADGSRFILRKLLGLDSDRPPGFAPEFSNGRSVGFLPPSGKIYPVEQLMGGVSSFRSDIFRQHRFSTYFEGYGLYEDADFTFRVSRTGPLYCNTAARLSHHHHPSGRPNQYRYGLMVVRNGWYVWRVRHPKPSLKARVKWNLIMFLLTLIRFSNIFTTASRKQAFTEALGRTAGWWSLWFRKPRPL